MAMRAGSVALLVLFAMSMLHSASAQSGASACSQTLRDSLDLAGLSMGEAAEALGCRQVPGGAWIEATIGDSVDYVHVGGLDPAAQPFLNDGRTLLIDLIKQMVNDPRLARRFVYNVDTYVLKYPGVGGTLETIDLEGETLATTPESAFLGMARSGYEQAAASYLLDPSNGVLAGYTAWYIQRRDSAILAATGAIPLIQQQGFRSYYGYMTIPWPWQLADPFTMDAYTIWSVAAAGPISPPSAPQPGTGLPDGIVPPPTLQVSILDEEGYPLPDACVRVIGPRAEIPTCDNLKGDLYDAIGSIHIAVPPDTYTVTIFQTPYGYVPLVDSQSVTVSSSSELVVFTLRRSSIA